MNKLVMMSVMVLPALIGACGEDKGGEEADPRLELFRSAVPTEEQLRARAPQASSAARDVGDPAQYPIEGLEVADDVNNLVTGLVGVLRQIVDLPPTVYNSDTNEYLWGPWDNDDDFGKVAAYIRENPEGDDFRFSFALLRGVSNDAATWAPIIWGGTNPDPDNEDFGSGVMLLDFEANHAWSAEHESDFESQTFTRGRFVAVFGKGLADDGSGATFAFNVAHVANFAEGVPAGATEYESGDADYFYGRYDGEHSLDFLDFVVTGNLFPEGDLHETYQVRLAFLDNGTGRAEVNASGGDIPEGDSAQGQECWDDAITQTHKLLQYFPAGGEPSNIEEPVGVEADCGVLFQQTLDELNVPSLAALWADHPDLQTALYTVAETGVPAE